MYVPLSGVVQLTHTTEDSDQPDVAVDSAGNIHVVYFDENGSSDRELWYTMP